MSELMSWRARVGVFNGIRARRTRIKPQFCKSDINLCLIAICKTYVALLKPIPSLNYQQQYCPTIFSLIILPLFFSTYLSATLSKCRLKSHITIRSITHYLFIFLPILLIISGNVHTNPGPENKNYSICHLNARSLTVPNRVEEIKNTLFHIHNFNIIAVTETHLDDSVQDYKISLPSYKFFRHDRNRFGGGVGIYCQDNFSPSRRMDLERPDLEIIWVEYNISNKKHLLASCYRPPGQSRLISQNFYLIFQVKCFSSFTV